MEVTCVVCKNCKKKATKDLKWIKLFKDDEEVLICGCGGREWIFVSLDVALVTDDLLVVNKRD